eukprot:684731-Karenia_brevis.AAC.1
MHDTTEASLHSVSLGRVIVGEAGVIKNAPWRAERLRQAARYLQARPRVRGRELEYLLGHI